MEKETNKEADSPGGKTGDTLFRGAMYLLYGKKAGETAIEKVARVGIIILFLVALIMVFSTVKRTFSP